MKSTSSPSLPWKMSYFNSVVCWVFGLTYSPASLCSGSSLIGFIRGNVFQSHTCEIPPHLLPISSGHNAPQREKSHHHHRPPHALIHWTAALLLLQRRGKKAPKKRLTAAFQLSDCCLFCPLPFLLSVWFVLFFDHLNPQFACYLFFSLVSLF